MSSKSPIASAKQFSKMKKHPAGSSAAASWTDGSGRFLLIGVFLQLLLAAIAGQLRVVAPRALEDYPNTSNELSGSGLSQVIQPLWPRQASRASLSLTVHRTVEGLVNGGDMLGITLENISKASQATLVSALDETCHVVEKHIKKSDPSSPKTSSGFLDPTILSKTAEKSSQGPN